MRTHRVPFCLAPTQKFCHFDRSEAEWRNLLFVSRSQMLTKSSNTKQPSPKTDAEKPGLVPGFLWTCWIAPNGARQLVLLLANLLAIPLACQCFLHALLLTGLQVKGVTLHFLDDVFLLHLALKAAKSILEGLTLLQTNFCQCKNTPLSGHAGQLTDYRIPAQNARPPVPNHYSPG